MAVGMRHMATLSFLFGAASFILGVIAENIKPDAGTPMQGKGVIICNYPSSSFHYVAFGFLSLAFLVLSTLVGFVSLSLTYSKKHIPSSALYGSGTMKLFLYITLLWTLLGAALILWPTLTEFLHRINNIHKSLLYECPTAKTGLLGGGSLVSLTSSLLWLICLMLAKNAREDYFEEIEQESKGQRTQVIINVDYQDLPSGKE